MKALYVYVFFISTSSDSTLFHNVLCIVHSISGLLQSFEWLRLQLAHYYDPILSRPELFLRDCKKKFFEVGLYNVRYLSMLGVLPAADCISAPKSE